MKIIQADRDLAKELCELFDVEDARMPRSLAIVLAAHRQSGAEAVKPVEQIDWTTRCRQPMSNGDLCALSIAHVGSHQTLSGRKFY